MSDSIIVENINKTVIIRFNRPEAKNPLSVDTLERLRVILRAVDACEDAEKIVFTGTGDAFAAGANLNEIARVNAQTAREFALRGQSLMNEIAAASAVTIAAVNGFCFGGALDLALACDRRIAAPRAVFSHPGANLGIMTGWGGTQRLPRLVGEAAALEMFLTAQRVDAREAKRIGLIDEIAENPLEFSLANAAAKKSS